jgi:hypothetical protein
MLYNICGLNVSYEPKYERTRARSEKYISPDQSLKADIVLQVTDERIENYIKVFPYVPLELAEYCIYGAIFYEAILDYDAFFLHSSAIAVDNEAYLFTANSGTGKSTHSALWMKYFGERAVMINDDKPVIRMIDGKLYACGTPFSGKHDINKNILVPIKGICCLNRGEKNEIEEISNREALNVIMNQTLRLGDKSKMINLFEILDKVLKNVKVYSLHCDISKQAVEVSYNGMQ